MTGEYGGFEKKKGAPALRAGAGELTLRRRQQWFWQKYYLAAVCNTVPKGRKKEETVALLAQVSIGEQIWQELKEDCDQYTKSHGQLPVTIFDLYFSAKSKPKVVKMDLTTENGIAGLPSLLLGSPCDPCETIIRKKSFRFEIPTAEWIDSLPFASRLRDAIAETDRLLREWNLDGYDTRDATPSSSPADLLWMRCAVMATASDYVHFGPSDYKPNDYSLDPDPDTYPEFAPDDWGDRLDEHLGVSWEGPSNEEHLSDDVVKHSPVEPTVQFNVDAFMPDRETEKGFKRRATKQLMSEIQDHIESRKDLAQRLGLEPTTSKQRLDQFQRLASYQVAGLSMPDIRLQSDNYGIQDAFRTLNVLASRLGMPLRKSGPKGRPALKVK